MEFLLAFLGGVILNIMPCVFPVLSVKVLALVKQPKSKLYNSLSYTAGIMLSFLILSGILILLRNLGFVVGWGYNLQSPMFVMIMFYLLFSVGLSLSGVFELPMRSLGNTSSGGNWGSFFIGVLAVLVATPCTGPFMATAIGFALTEPPLTTLMIFQSLGLGFAFPYLLLSSFPRLLSVLPKPGAWMVKFKEFLAFPMYVSAIWLLWVLIKQTNSTVILTASSGALMIVFSIWLWGVVKNYSKQWRHLFIILLLFLNVIPVKVSYDLIHTVYKQNWISHSESNLQRLLNEHRKVLVVVTADWCLTCKVNENLVLSSSVIQDELQDNDIVYMLADWTQRDKRITEYVSSFNRIGVPLYVLYDDKGNYQLLPQILTTKIMLDAIESIK